MLNNVKKAIKNPNLALHYILPFKIFRLIPDELFTKIEYRLKIERKINLENPKTFNEKIQWLKLNDNNPTYARLVDKYDVRKYVKERIGENYLVPLIGVYNSVDEIPFQQLPQNYVLKCTHDSGTAIIKNEFCTLSINEMKAKLNKAMQRQFFYEHREKPYKHIKPRIICEELIKTSDGNPPRDYKIFCFDGEPKFSFVALDRGNGTKFNFYDLEWNKYPVMQHYPNSEKKVPKPGKWEHMLSLARELSKGIKHVRVDFYIDSDDNIFFGELTFYHFSGIEKFEPEEYDEYFGRYLKI